MKTKEIKITNGAFCSGNCTDCLYADLRDTDSYGRVRCNGGYGGYNKPQDRNGCFHWARK